MLPKEGLYSIDQALPINPDQIPLSPDCFDLKADYLPPHLHHLLDQYEFRRCDLKEITKSSSITQEGWPGIQESSLIDLNTRDHINAPMCGVFDKQGNMVAYSRLLWGFDNTGAPEIHSHMTAVSNKIRDGGVGEALKWQARQISLLFPRIPIEQLSVTFDNLQGRNSHVNLNKLGIVCGAAGGKYCYDFFGASTGKQHLGTPTDRFFGRWYLNSNWTLAHLNESHKPLTLEVIKDFPGIIDYTYDSSTGSSEIITPVNHRENLTDQVLTLAVPLRWDILLTMDEETGYKLANLWRSEVRHLLSQYFQKGYTAVAQVTDRENSVNHQILFKNFNPFDPPRIFLK